MKHFLVAVLVLLAAPTWAGEEEGKAYHEITVGVGLGLSTTMYVWGRASHYDKMATAMELFMGIRKGLLKEAVDPALVKVLNEQNIKELAENFVACADYAATVFRPGKMMLEIAIFCVDLPGWRHPGR